MQTIPNSNEPFLSFVPAGSVDKTRYLGFYTAGGNAGNTGSLWYDESGKGNHLTNADPDDVFVKTVDAAGKPVMRSSNATGGVFKLPFPTTAASDYSIYAVLRPDSLQNPYFLDTPGHAFALGFNNSDFGAFYYGGIARGVGALSLGAGELALVSWRLNAAELGRVYKNAAEVVAAGYAQVPLGAVAALGHEVSSYYAPFNGDLHAFVIRTGNDTDAEAAQVQGYLATLAGISL